MLFAIVSDDDDREFLEAIYNKYKGMLFYTAMSCLHDANRAEDVVHDVFAKVIPKLHYLHSFDQRRLRSYLTAATRNTAITVSKAIHVDNSRLISLSAENIWLTDPCKSMDEYLHDKERMESFGNAIKELDDQNRYILMAKYILQATDDEIAEKLHVKASSVRMMLTRARREVIAIIQEMDNNG